MINKPKLLHIEIFSYFHEQLGILSVPHSPPWIGSMFIECCWLLVHQATLTNC